MHKTWLVSGCLVLALGCGKKDKDEGAGGAAADKPKAGATAGGCDRRGKENVCGEYHGGSKAAWVKEQCTAMSATYVEKCPTDGAVGRCVNEAGTAMETHTLFYGPAYTKEAMVAMCGAPMQLRDP